MNIDETKLCKYCTQKLVDCTAEGLTCILCQNSVHLRCLKSAVPGGLHGDVFFDFTCLECSDKGSEIYIRQKISWLKVIVLALYDLQTRNPGLGRKGYFHWRNHIASLVDRNWSILFHYNFKKKKQFIGTIVGTLSRFNSFYFKSGVTVVKEQAWWALQYPKLSPNVISNLYSAFIDEKQKAKLFKKYVSDNKIFEEVLEKHIPNKDLLTPIFPEQTLNLLEPNNDDYEDESKKDLKQQNFSRKRSLLPTFDNTSRKYLKLKKNALPLPTLDNSTSFSTKTTDEIKSSIQNKILEQTKDTFLDPFCYYNTSFTSLSKQKGLQLGTRLMGNVRKELILSPYSGIYLKPYIRRDCSKFPLWLKIMTQVQLKANQRNGVTVNLTRAPIDYTYVQPEHIPAINSLCNNFFWPGIDMTDCLQYPEFSCVVMYKKLVIGFAFLVPNVGHTESYISFIFTRPGWRNAGIGKFMLYHLIQTSLGKDITLHVSMNNPAMLLYQKMGFKIESVVLDFYDKYIRSGTNESKHAFFCRFGRILDK